MGGPNGTCRRLGPREGERMQAREGEWPCELELDMCISAQQQKTRDLRSFEISSRSMFLVDCNLTKFGNSLFDHNMERDRAALIKKNYTKRSLA